ncbi:MAG: hypothetical protein JXR95_13475 [Deltaproteobacteria bacterium]|nr:hypothetical protein [Deltaproteobacteria bacterium]
MKKKMCHLCFALTDSGVCPYCGTEIKTVDSTNLPLIESFKTDQLLANAYGGEIYKGRNSEDEEKLIWISTENFESEPGDNGFRPEKVGVSGKYFYMIYPVPEESVCRKSRSIKESISVMEQISQDLKMRFINGSEVQPWEIVFHGGLWKIWNGWDFQGSSRIYFRRTPYTPPEKYSGSEVSEKSLTYFLGAVFYNIYSGKLPMGLLSPPSGKNNAPDNQDLFILRSLSYNSSDRVSPERFLEELNSISNGNIVLRRMMFGISAIAGASFLAILGYGLSVIFSMIY